MSVLKMLKLARRSNYRVCCQYIDTMQKKKKKTAFVQPLNLFVSKRTGKKKKKSDCICLVVETHCVNECVKESL